MQRSNQRLQDAVARQDAAVEATQANERERALYRDVQRLQTELHRLRQVSSSSGLSNGSLTLLLLLVWQSLDILSLMHVRLFVCHRQTEENRGGADRENWSRRLQEAERQVDGLQVGKSLPNCIWAMPQHSASQHRRCSCRKCTERCALAWSLQAELGARLSVEEARELQERLQTAEALLDAQMVTEPTSEAAGPEPGSPGPTKSLISTLQVHCSSLGTPILKEPEAVNRPLPNARLNCFRNLVRPGTDGSWQTTTVSGSEPQKRRAKRRMPGRTCNKR